MKKLMRGVFSDDLQLVKDRLAAGDSPNIKDRGTPALIYACVGYHYEIAKALIAGGADVNAIQRDGATALIRTSMLGSPAYVSLILDTGADVNMEDDEGNTALMMAAKGGNLENVKLIHQAGAKINTANNDGVTPLLWSLIWDDFPEVVEFLLENGADPMMSAKYDGKSAIELARELKRVRSLKFLERDRRI